jgi:hypothetical protein
VDLGIAVQIRLPDRCALLRCLDATVLTLRIFKLLSGDRDFETQTSSNASVSVLTHIKSGAKFESGAFYFSRVEIP